MSLFVPINACSAFTCVHVYLYTAESMQLYDVCDVYNRMCSSGGLWDVAEGQPSHKQNVERLAQSQQTPRE